MANAAAIDSEREFNFSEKDFQFLVKLTRERTGIVLSNAKRNMVYGRLVRRLRSLGLDNFAAYRALVDGAGGEAELGNMINAITTNLTRFFREEHHFEHLRRHLFEPRLEATRSGGPGRLRIWSAGSSSGEEAYSIAMTLASSIRNYEQWDARILATDLDTNVLAKGTAAVYSGERLAGLPAELRRRFVTPLPGKSSGRSSGDGSGEGEGRIVDGIRRLVTFRQLNLLGPWPLKQEYDAIFCRNVVIYFSSETKEELIRRYARQLKIGGFLYLGHSESLMDPGPDLRMAGRTTYEKIQ